MAGCGHKHIKLFETGVTEILVHMYMPKIYTDAMYYYIIEDMFCVSHHYQLACTTTRSRELMQSKHGIVGSFFSITVFAKSTQYK